MFGRRILALASYLALAGCSGSVIQTVPMQFGGGPSVEIDGLTPCTGRSTEPARLDPERPTVVLVHGCNDSAARFTALAEVFEAHGQQAICFTYESRDRIETGARRLRRSLAELERRAPGHPITVIGHSQGGLVSRLALTEPLGEVELEAEHELVTISSPFAGIAAARHCALKWLYGVSLGITPAICHSVAGKNWVEIHRRSPLVERPGALDAAVSGYVQIRTDEEDACRARKADGGCDDDDFVFTLEEQRNPKTVGPRARIREVTAGHVEIVGDGQSIPTTLIEVLQAEGVMNPTSPDQREAVAALLHELYIDAPAPPTKTFHADHPGVEAF